MQKVLTALTKDEIAVLARIKIEVTLGLLALASGLDLGLKAMAGKRAFGLGLSAPGVPLCRLVQEGRDGRAEVKVAPKGEGRLSLVLRFPSQLAAIRLLSGAKAAVLPIPRGVGAGAALGFFRAAAAKAPGLLKPGALSPGARARLLAGAALSGLCAVGNSDKVLAERMHHIPSGKVAVVCPGAFAFGVEKSGGELRFCPEAPEAPNARLEFRDAETAIGVFAGGRPAILALADGGVSIRGYLPLIQGLFAILDRLGEYMAVKVEE